MNSNFPALTYRDTLLQFLEKVAMTDLAKSSCVCHIWYSMASGDDITRPMFMSPWKLKEVISLLAFGGF
ncbi:F-box protein At1g55000 [Linum perenne]